MTRPRIGGLLVGLIATLALATNVYATTPTPVTITVVDHVDGSGDPFVSTGGLICAAGAGLQRLQPVRRLARTDAMHRSSSTSTSMCDDGTFDVLLRVTLDFETCDTVATWSVL